MCQLSHRLVLRAVLSSRHEEVCLFLGSTSFHASDEGCADVCRRSGVQRQRRHAIGRRWRWCSQQSWIRLRQRRRDWGTASRTSRSSEVHRRVPLRFPPMLRWSECSLRPLILMSICEGRPSGGKRLLSCSTPQEVCWRGRNCTPPSMQLNGSKRSLLKFPAHSAVGCE